MSSWLRCLSPLAALLFAAAPASGEEPAVDSSPLPPVRSAIGKEPVADSPLPPLVRCVVEVPQQCIVVTRGGSIFVGQLTALVPSERLQLRLITREERVVPWAEVISALPLAPTPSASGPGAQEAPVDATITGMVSTMRIEQRPRGLTEEAPWGPVCRAPCTPLELYPGYDYRVADSQVPGAPEFEVPHDVSSVRLHIRHGNQRRRRAGLGLLITGSILTAAAIPLAYVYVLSHSSSSSGDPLAGQIATAVLSGLGIPAVAGGAALFVTGSTRVDLIPILAGNY